jgi:hypothetical protein
MNRKAATSVDEVAAFFSVFYRLKILEHRAGFEPANTGFADLRVSHFATGA